MEVKIEKQPKSTLKLTIKVENQKIKEAFEKSLDKAVETVTIEGFRKGKAPREMVKEKVGLSNLYGEVVNDILQTFYPQALKENHIVPVANPKVELKEFDIEKDLEFTALVAVRPEVKLKEFKQKVKENYTKRLEEQKKENEEKIKKGEKIDESHIHVSPNEMIEEMLNAAEVEISDLLISEETDRMMARLMDQAQTIGLSIDQYLKAQNKTAEQLRQDYAAMAEKNIKAEFVLAHLVVQTNVTVDDKEIEETMRAAGYPDVEKRMENAVEKFYVKSILQKNKLISNLIEEIEGENHHEHN